MTGQTFSDKEHGPLPEPPDPLEKRIDALVWKAKEIKRRLAKDEKEKEKLQTFLELQPGVAQRLEELSADLFADILIDVEQNLSYALAEVLGQDIRVVTHREVMRGKVSISFSVERNGNEEDILRGQGGSVANVLSVGLRLIALSQLDEKEHRRFLIVDEQDCWLRPDLVPNLMGIIHTVARKLGFQVLVISHHDVSSFKDHADRIYRILPAGEPGSGVRLVQEKTAERSQPDIEL